MRKLVWGGILIFFGLFMLLGFFASTKERSLSVDGIMLVLFVCAPLTGGAWLIVSHLRERRQLTEESRKKVTVEREREIFRLAHRKGGKLMLSEIVEETSMSMDEAEEVLRELVVRQQAGMNTAESGAVVYEFFEITGSTQN